MKIKALALKSLFLVMALFSIIFSLSTALTLISFVVNPGNKETLQLFLGTLILTTLFWAITFFVSSLDKEKSKKERWAEIKDLFVKLPLILASSAITSVYVLLYFFFFAFITVSGYGDGGIGADSTMGILLTVFAILGTVIFGLVMYKVFKTEKQDISLTLYNQFSILKWSSLIVMPFGLWASYYFYSSQSDISAWIAMIIWGLIFYGIYRLLGRLAEKVHDQITNANVNRILHEKKKSMVNKNFTTQLKPLENISSIGIADELRKFKELLDQGVITQEEFDFQKQRLIQKM
jgi:hypothetical protein